MHSKSALVTILLVAMQAIGIAATEVTILKKGERIAWVDVEPGTSKSVNIRGRYFTVSVSDSGEKSISGSKYTVE